MRIWKENKEFSYIEVSIYGQVRNKYTKELLIPIQKEQKFYNKYQYVKLEKGGSPYYKPIHRLVLETFNNKDKNTCIVHLDDNFNNNNLDNLMYFSLDDYELIKEIRYNEFLIARGEYFKKYGNKGYKDNIKNIEKNVNTQLIPIIKRLNKTTKKEQKNN